jgi:KaiC/GvpD/RAD55 family RecA-like ATPase
VSERGRGFGRHPGRRIAARRRLSQGDPGSGKTTLALQFLLEGLRRGESVFYITLSETGEELERGWIG